MARRGYITILTAIFMYAGWAPISGFFYGIGIARLFKSRQRRWQKGLE